MPSSSDLEITFNFEYDNADQARNAVNLRSGEFSMTYTAMDGGFGEFDIPELLRIEHIYQSLRDKFSSGKQSCHDPYDGIPYLPQKTHSTSVKLTRSNHDDDDDYDYPDDPTDPSVDVITSGAFYLPVGVIFLLLSLFSALIVA